MTRRAQTGRHTRIEKPKTKRRPLMPLDYVLRVMRDGTRPDAARDAMAIAAMRFLHPRGASANTPPDGRDKPPPLSRRALAARVARLLSPDAVRGNKKERRRAKRAQANARDLPHQPAASMARPRARAHP